MPLYILTLNKKNKRQSGYVGVIVRASDKEQARMLTSVDTNEGMWCDPKLTDCVVLAEGGRPQVVLHSYVGD